MKISDIFQERVCNLPNSLSLTRILLLIPAVWLNGYYLSEPNRYFLYLFTILFLIFITDFFDGLLARKLSQTTMLGRYLDPIGDKIVSVVALYILTKHYSFPVWIFVFYIIKELIGLSLAGFLFFKRDVQGAPNIWGKLGVGVIALVVLWYFSLPFLKTIGFSEKSMIFKPEYGAYFIPVLLTISMIHYTATYGKTVLRR